LCFLSFANEAAAFTQLRYALFVFSAAALRLRVGPQTPRRRRRRLRRPGKCRARWRDVNENSRSLRAQIFTLPLPSCRRRGNRRRRRRRRISGLLRPKTSPASPREPGGAASSRHNCSIKSHLRAAARGNKGFRTNRPTSRERPAVAKRGRGEERVLRQQLRETSGGDEEGVFGETGRRPPSFRAKRPTGNGPLPHPVFPGRRSIPRRSVGFLFFPADRTHFCRSSSLAGWVFGVAPRVTADSTPGAPSVAGGGRKRETDALADVDECEEEGLPPRFNCVCVSAFPRLALLAAARFPLTRE